MKSSVAFLMCVLAGSSVVSGLKCYDYTCPTASTLTTPASSAADCVGASAATGNGGGACVYTPAVAESCAEANGATDARCDGVTVNGNAATCTGETASAGESCGVASDARCAAVTLGLIGTQTACEAETASAGESCSGDVTGATACANVTMGVAGAEAACILATNGATPAAACTYTPGAACAYTPGAACAHTALVAGSQTDCGNAKKTDGVTACDYQPLVNANAGSAANCAATTSTGAAAVTATTDTCTPCKNTCATGQECYNQEGTSAGNIGGCTAAGGESGALAGGGTQSVCTTDLCNDNTGTSPAFRAEFLSALVVAIFASLY